MSKFRRCAVVAIAVSAMAGVTAAPAMAHEGHHHEQRPLVNVEIKPSLRLADEIEVEDLGELSSSVDVVGQARDVANGVIASLGVSL